MYCIEVDEKYFFHDKGKIIIFDDINDAIRFVTNFFKYAEQRMIKENMMGMIAIHQLQSVTRVIEIDFNIEDCSTINFKNLKR